MKPNRSLAGLRDLMSQCFGPEELHGLAIDFRFDYDELEGNQSRRVVTFIERMVRDGHIVEFIERCAELKPRGGFGPFVEIAKQNPDAFKLRSFENQGGSPETAVYQALNKALGLIEAQSHKIEQLTRPNDHTSPYSSDQMRINKDAFNQTNKSWEKSSKIGDNISSSLFSPDKTATADVDKSLLQDSKLQGEIEKLEAHIAEEIEDLLSGIRERIKTLKEKLSEHQQLVQDESLRATRSSFGFRGKQKSAFPTGKSPFARE